jgi:hypothetical protein
VDVCLERPTVWLTEAHMAERFGRERPVVTEQIRNVFAERELDERSKVQNLHILRRKKCRPACLPASR